MRSAAARPDVYRLTIGVRRQTFDLLVARATNPKYAALDGLLPHPVYAQQHWVSILNPSAETTRRSASRCSRRSATGSRQRAPGIGTPGDRRLTPALIAAQAG